MKEECHKNKCMVVKTGKSICVGDEMDQPCQNSTTCDRGLYCHVGHNESTGTCKLQRDIGYSCDHTMSCVNWGLCNNSICIQKRTLNISAYIESP